MMLQVTSKDIGEGWSPEADARLTAERKRRLNGHLVNVVPRERVTLALVPPALRKSGAARLYLTPIGPRWHTEMYEQPIGPQMKTPYGRSLSSILLFIQECVAEKHRITVADLRGRSRKHQITQARAEMFWRCKHETYGWSLPAIGHILGRFDHTSVLYGIRRHQARIDAGENVDAVRDILLVTRKPRRG